MASILTGSRILLSAALLFFPVFSPVFYVLYLTAGFTDMLDGPIARKTGKADAFGARFDTAADMVFTTVCLIKLLPALCIPVWVWVWIGVIAFVKAVNLISGYMLYKRLTAVHTVLNKVTGALLFVLPLTLPVVELRYSAAAVCALATFAAVQEGHFIRTGRAEQEGKR